MDVKTDYRRRRSNLPADKDAVDKAEAALAALEDGRRKKTPRLAAAPASGGDVRPLDGHDIGK